MRYISKIINRFGHDGDVMNVKSMEYFEVTDDETGNKETIYRRQLYLNGNGYEIPNILGVHTVYDDDSDRITKQNLFKTTEMHLKLYDLLEYVGFRKYYAKYVYYDLYKPESDNDVVFTSCLGPIVKPMPLGLLFELDIISADSNSEDYIKTLEICDDMLIVHCNKSDVSLCYKILDMKKFNLLVTKWKVLRNS